ncbi:MAG: DUF2182 domain-containing protein [SAR324 cluster bacterium]|nr:DUF2182 domain-containing protein [SAR324 cluster bacterium]
MNAEAGRRLFLSLMGGVVVLAWVTLWVWEQSPYGRYLSHGGLGTLELPEGPRDASLRAALYVAGWLLMTVAMMLPTTLPLITIFRRLVMPRGDGAQLLGLLIAGYLGVWLFFGLVAHLADWMLHEALAQSAWLTAHAWAIGAGTLLLAGGFQFSSLKYRCLDKCRAPLSFVMERWRGSRERWNAFALGMQHGLFCVGCCWALMLLMFGVGIGNVGWMLGLGAVMAIEKNLPWGRRLAAPLGIALIVWGLAIVVQVLVMDPGAA